MGFLSHHLPGRRFVPGGSRNGARQDAIVTTGLVAFASLLPLLPSTSPMPVLVLLGLLLGLPAGTLVAAPAAVLTPAYRGPGLGQFYTWSTRAWPCCRPPPDGLEDRLGHPAALHFAAVVVTMSLAAFFLARRVAAHPRHRPPPERALDWQ
jgi:hypothetical protein